MAVSHPVGEEDQRDASIWIRLGHITHEGHDQRAMVDEGRGQLLEVSNNNNDVGI